MMRLRLLGTAAACILSLGLPDPALAQAPVRAQPVPAQSQGQLPAPPDLREDAFKATVDSTLPLSPQQIKDIRRILDQGQKAAAQPPGPPTRLESRSEDVSMEPGARIPTVRLGANHVAMLAFYDSTGQQWPVLKVVVGNGERAQVMVMGEGSNTISVTPQVYHGTTNIGVMLDKASMPVTLALSMDSAVAAADALVSFRVQARGPNAQAPIMQARAPEAGNAVLMAFLDGTPPDGAQPLFLGSGTGRAWSHAGFVYLRTQMTLLSPSWLASVSGSAGFSVYQIAETPVLLASDQGRQISVRLSEMPRSAATAQQPPASPNAPIRIAGPSSVRSPSRSDETKQEANGN